MSSLQSKIISCIVRTIKCKCLDVGEVCGLYGEIETYVILQPGEVKGRDDLEYERIILKWVLNWV
jgi:hypothetical protein